MHGAAGLQSHMHQTERDVPAEMADRLIVALDVESVAEAERIVKDLNGVVSFFKIGLWLLFADGTDGFITQLIMTKKDIFLDYKMFDIPETVQRGVERAKSRGIKFVTVHGDEEIVAAAVKGKGDSDRLKIFTITVLTSMDDSDLREMGYRWTVNEMVEHRVRNALKWGSDGIIASAHDNPNEIRNLVENRGLLIATPGVRSEGVSHDDHKRVSTPSEAIRDGADYIIMGRQILQDPNPRAAAERVIEEMRAAAASA